MSLVTSFHGMNSSAVPIVICIAPDITDLIRSRYSRHTKLYAVLSRTQCCNVSRTGRPLQEMRVGKLQPRWLCSGSIVIALALVLVESL